MNQSEQPIISCAGLVKIYKVAGLEVVALQGLDLDVVRGELLALIGPSGAGKSTLLSLLGGLDRPSAGRLEVAGRNLLALSQAELTTYRRQQVGFVWQQTARNLLPYLTARENIELLMTLFGRSWRERRRWTDELLTAVGMESYADQKLTQLSGGQQQRIAIACALANKPTTLLGDEPTGAVDWPTAQRILILLHDLRTRYDLTVVLVTHDQRVAGQADRVVAIRDGRTSTEAVRITDRQPTTDGQPATEDTLHSSSLPRPLFEELVVLDRAGRLQLPSEQRALAGIRQRARVELVEDGILIRPGDEEQIDAAALTAAQEDHLSYQALYTSDRLPSDGTALPRRRWRFRWWKQ